MTDKLMPTDAMIEAGVEAAEKQFWEDVSSHDVKAIYTAMQAARPPLSDDKLSGLVELVRIEALQQQLSVKDEALGNLLGWGCHDEGCACLPENETDDACECDCGLDAAEIAAREALSTTEGSDR